MKLARSDSKSSLFLMELILAILFFSLCSAVCVRLFAQARLESLSAAELNRAVLAAQTAAESYRAAEGDPEAFRALTGAAGSGGELDLYYGADWSPLDAGAGEAAAYRARLSAGGSDGLYAADIAVERLTPEGGCERIYLLQTKVYAPAA